MKNIIFAIGIAFAIFGCSTAKGSGMSKGSETDVYLCSIKNETENNVYAISLQSGVSKGLYSHTHDRYKGSTSMLIRMELGTFERDGDNIAFKSKETPPYTGKFTENGLEVEGRIYLKK